MANLIRLRQGLPAKTINMPRIRTRSCKKLAHPPANSREGRVAKTTPTAEKRGPKSGAIFQPCFWDATWRNGKFPLRCAARRQRPSGALPRKRGRKSGSLATGANSVQMRQARIFDLNTGSTRRARAPVPRAASKQARKQASAPDGARGLRRLQRLLTSTARQRSLGITFGRGRPPKVGPGGRKTPHKLQTRKRPP